MDFPQAMRVLRALERHRVEYVLVGSMAMAAQGLVRATEIEGLRIRVATPRTLYLMKKNTVRGQDRLDAEMLKERFGLEDE